MSDNEMNKKKRSNSLDLTISSLTLNEEKDEAENKSNKSKLFSNDKKIISYKILQNIDLTTYDYMFMKRKILNESIHDFESFKTLLNKIKSQFKPELLQNNINLKIIQKEGKFCFNKSNLTELILINDKDKENIDISINSKCIKAEVRDDNSSHNNYFLYGTKSFFKGKHCFEIEISNINKINIAIGLVNININFEQFKSDIKEGIDSINFEEYLLCDIFLYKVSEPIFIKKDNIPYHHYIIYGDVFGVCFDLDEELFYLFLNGEIITIDFLKIDLYKKNSYIPFIYMSNDNEIIFNAGDLKFEKIYRSYGFTPLDEDGSNNFEISNLKKVTDNYLDIIINYGKLIIKNKNISYSDINQIFHIMFEFLGKYSFIESYIIHNCIIKKFYLNKNYLIDKNNYEIYYICLKFILNYSKRPKIIMKNIILNISETLNILNKRSDNNVIAIVNLLNLLIFLFSKNEIKDILSGLQKSLFKLFNNIFTSIFLSDNLRKNYLDFVMNPNNLVQNQKQYGTDLLISKYSLENKINKEINLQSVESIPFFFFCYLFVYLIMVL